MVFFLYRAHQSHLVSVNSKEEMEYLQSRIKELVERQGQRFAREQWWTSGAQKGNAWVWEDTPQGRYLCETPLRVGELWETPLRVDELW